MIIPNKINKITVILLGIFSAAVIWGAHIAVSGAKWFVYKRAAAEIMLKAEQELSERIQINGFGDIAKGAPYFENKKINLANLKFLKFLIGPDKQSPLITTEGKLLAKLGATNPNFAAIVVDFFRQAGVEEGDVIAVAFSGSLPGANIAVLSAAKAMNLTPVIISSVGASSWGATSPDMSWLDMEKYLFDRGIFPYRSVAASMGGKDDIQEKKTDEEKKVLIDIIKRNEIELLYEEDVEKNTMVRLATYERYAQGKPVKAFVNSGGDSAVVGIKSFRKYIPHGIVTELPLEKFPRKGVIMVMVEKGIPVINLKNIQRIFKKYKMSLVPEKFPGIGDGKVYMDKKVNLRVGIICFFALILIFVVIINLDIYLFPHIVEKARKIKEILCNER
ncbi:MAG: poly-gamma-glutamate system protein [Candidatus Omnitrophota bacterium]